MDRLTGLADRGEFARSFPTLFAQERISVALFDVDNLRALNDRDGHKEVDQVLVRLGSLMQERCGAGEMAARVGGDEFALPCSKTNRSRWCRRSSGSVDASPMKLEQL
jgi:diguanylate cyclase (GGDEF)-like protein